MLNCAHTNVYEKPKYFMVLWRHSVYSGHILDEKAVRAQHSHVCSDQFLSTLSLVFFIFLDHRWRRADSVQVSSECDDSDKLSFNWSKR